MKVFRVLYILFLVLTLACVLNLFLVLLPSPRSRDTMLRPPKQDLGVIVHFWEGPILNFDSPENFWHRTGLVEQACLISYKRKDFKKAKVVVFHHKRVHDHILQFGPSFRLPKRAFPEQLYVIFIHNPPKELPPMHVFSDFNFSISYRYHNQTELRTIWRPTGPYPSLFPYQAIHNFSWNDSIKANVNFSAKDPTFLASYFAHLCRTRSNRDALTERLIASGVRVAGFGACGHALNGAKGYPELAQAGRYNADGLREKMSLLGRFKFYFAFENALCPDYVSEKVWQALIAGTIPVFWGDPEWRLFPRNSVIHAADFPSIRALAQFILAVGSNETLFNTFHAWRHEEPEPEFARLLATSRSPSSRKIAEPLCQAARDWPSLFPTLSSLQAVPILGECVTPSTIFPELLDPPEKAAVSLFSQLTEIEESDSGEKAVEEAGEKSDQIAKNQDQNFNKAQENNIETVPKQSKSYETENSDDLDQKGFR